MTLQCLCLENYSQTGLNEVTLYSAHCTIHRHRVVTMQQYYNICTNTVTRTKQVMQFRSRVALV